MLAYKHYTVRTRKQYIAIYFSVFDVTITKQIVLQDNNHQLSEIGLFTLHNCFGSCSLDYLRS